MQSAAAIHCKVIVVSRRSFRAPQAFPCSPRRFSLKTPSERPKWLRVDRVLGEPGIIRDNPGGRLEFSRRREERRPLDDEQTDAYRVIRRGWRFGSAAFVERMVEQIEEDSGENQTWPERAERMELRAERLISEGLREAGWRRPRLAKEPKGHPVKVELARKLRRETTMTLQWIAAALFMGSWTYVFNLLRPVPVRRKRSAKDTD